MSYPEIAYNKTIISGFHGTSKEVALKIYSEQAFQITPPNKDSYLGVGVYFYENQLWHAENWARKRKKFDLIGIIKSLIEPNNCLDLDIMEHKKALEEYHKKLKATLNSTNKITDAQTINLFCKTPNINIDVVKFTYISMADNRPIYSGSKISNYIEKIVCVKNLKCIKKIEIEYLD